MARLRLARPWPVVVAAALALGGCAAMPGTAAVVDGERISVQEVNDAARDYEAVSGQDVLPAAVAYTLVDAQFVNEIAAGYGLGYSETEVVGFFTEQAELAGGTVPEGGFSDAFVELGRSLMVSSELPGSENAEAIVQDYTVAREAAEVEMNPRYGRLVNGQLAPVDHEWIATPAP